MSMCFVPKRGRQDHPPSQGACCEPSWGTMKTAEQRAAETVTEYSRRVSTDPFGKTGWAIMQECIADAIKAAVDEAVAAERELWIVGSNPKKFNFDAPDCTCGYRDGHVARNMCGHTQPCPVYDRWEKWSERNLARVRGT
jgi:hypothetical protein